MISRLQCRRYHLASAYRNLGRTDEARAEMVRFQELAWKSSERTQAQARELVDLSRGLTSSDDPEPGFSPERDPRTPLSLAFEVGFGKSA
jgi:hypothetical protein